jgi:hypothetical protein
MPTERMEEVEVVCPRCAGHGGERECCGHGGDECCGVPDIRRCPDCLGEGNIAKPVAPNSLTAARLRLADAAEAREVAHRKRMARIEMGLDCSVDREYLEALAAEEDAEDQEVEAFEALAALRTARGA